MTIEARSGREPTGVPLADRARGLPTEDDLPYDDGEPMDSPRHRMQMNLLIESLSLAWEGRTDVYIGGDMFVHYKLEADDRDYFKGPDVFVVQGTVIRDRKSWVVWQDGKGPDVVIELLSRRTLKEDQGRKKRVYQDELKVPEYFWFDPVGPEFAGFRLADGVYAPIVVDTDGRIECRELGLLLGRKSGRFQGTDAEWLRWMRPSGEVLPSQEERAVSAERRVERLTRALRERGDDPERV